MSRNMRIGAVAAAVIVALVFLFGPTLPAPAQTAGAGGLIRLIPKETDVAFIVRDMTDLKRTIAASPLATIWNHPGIQQYVELFAKKMEKDLMEFRKGTGIKVEELLSVFDGQAIFAISDLKTWLDKAKDAIKNGREFEDVGLPDIYLIAETKAKGAEAAGYVKTLLSKGVEADKGFYLKKDEYRGVEITAFGEKKFPIHYVQAPNMLVFTSTRKAAESLIAARPGGRESLADKDDFQQALRKIGNANDLALYFDASVLTDAVDLLATAVVRDAGVPVPGIDALIKGLANEVFGLECIRSYACGYKLDGAGASCNQFLATKGELKGMVKLFAGKSEKIVPTSIPREATYFGIANLEIGPFWASMEKTISDFMKSQADANPDFPAMNPFDMAEMMLGIDLKSDIVDNIGTTLSFYTLPVAPTAEKRRRRGDLAMGSLGRAVVLISLKDEAKMTATLTKLLSRPQVGEEVVKEEYMGKTVYKVKGGENEPAFAVTNGQFVFAIKADDLKGHIRRAGKAVESIADSDEFRQMSPWIPSACSMLIYTDYRYYHQSLRDSLEAWGMLLSIWGNDKIDLTKLPDEEFWKGILVGTVGSVVPERDGISATSYTKFRTGTVHK